MEQTIVILILIAVVITLAFLLFNKKTKSGEKIDGGGNIHIPSKPDVPHKPE